MPLVLTNGLFLFLLRQRWTKIYLIAVEIAPAHSDLCLERYSHIKWADLQYQRHCANCGFVYCSDCCEAKFKLLKFEGSDFRDVRVCDYCKEFLKSMLHSEDISYLSRSNAVSDINYHVSPFIARVH